MKKLSLIAFLFIGMVYGSFEQPSEIREMCKKAQLLESQISKLTTELAVLQEKGKMAIPVVHDIYKMLSRCVTVLFDITRFSNFLALHYKNKDDFIRCSIVIKNFSNYFQSVSNKLKQSGDEIYKLQQAKEQTAKDYEDTLKEYKKINEDIQKNLTIIGKQREERVIQDDVVYHIAAKSESIEELDAELEAENTVGVLKNTKISTALKLCSPVQGKIVEEFGDKGSDGEMIYHLGFETSYEAIVTSPAKGLVVFSGKFLDYGNMVIISNGEYRLFIYGMKTVFTATGDIINIGDYIGKMDGESKELPILKIQLKRSGEPLDPRHWLFQSQENGEKSEK